MPVLKNKPGSIWRCWDPHIHAPGTAFNDQFDGENPWEDYLDRLESAVPTLEAIGVTDYYSFDSYEQVREWKSKGRLPSVGLIFPNIEMRYAIGTASGGAVNFHLLISPEDPDHVAETKRFLERLTFKHIDDTYRCNRSDIIKLGKAHKEHNLDDDAAFGAGANQFKIEVDPFLEAWADCPWIRNNALIAIAASNNDGSAGLQKDASLTALRQKIERAAHIVFSSQPKQREFWLGKGVLSVEKLDSKYDGCKPCLHGTDAHTHEKIGSPSKDRFCWIKGDATFETLRQVCMEPDLRVRISREAPDGAFASQTITSISMKNADWFGQNPITLNSGLVGIIGARGSGKTALADMIANGAFALSPEVNTQSFAHRAKGLLINAKSILSWQDGSQTESTLSESEIEEQHNSPRVQYLSQQFVEQLCSAEGATDDLIAEVERVIFASHPRENRFGTENFNDLLGMVASRGRVARALHEDSIRGIGGGLARERDKKEGLAANLQKKKEFSDTLQKDKAERDMLTSQGSEAHVTDFNKVSAAVDKIREMVDEAKCKENELNLLSDYVRNFRTQISDRDLSDLKTRHISAALGEDDWQLFKTDFIGDVDTVIARTKTKTTELIAKLQGAEESELDANLGGSSLDEKSLIPNETDLGKVPLSLLLREESRLQRLIGIDKDKQNRHRKLVEKIRKTVSMIKTVDETISAAGKAEDEIQRLLELRNTSYEGVFEGIVSEESALRDLYQPLSGKLANATGALGNLAFSIHRTVDLTAWAEHGERLIDKRKEGSFKGKGTLLEAAETELGSAWRSGSASEVAAAMASFRKKHDKTIVDGSIVDRNNKDAWRSWGVNVSEWLYSTDHIHVNYNMRYEGIEIKTLSPGTRGIVLLLLYLAIDTEDDRPLIIDQPEENLDPKSIFNELVGLFRDVKQRRQIIIVTHNANLIVNTDADQVSVARRNRGVCQRSLTQLVHWKTRRFANMFATYWKAEKEHSENEQNGCASASDTINFCISILIWKDNGCRMNGLWR